MKIIYGTSNQAKIAQVKDYLDYKNIDVEILSLKDIGFNEEIDENGTTFEENSLIKAKAIKAYCEKNDINEIIMTDDAGLCIDALNGEPGVYSARYAGDHAPQIVAINKVLSKMENVKATTSTDEETGETTETDTLGVYVVTAGRAEFKPVTILTEGDDFYVVQSVREDKKALRAGDEVIVQATGLYDGQLLLY